MSRLLVRNVSISLDGYAAGPDQDLEHPLGVGGAQLHEWIFATTSGNQMIGREGGSEGLDDDFFSKRGSGGSRISTGLDQRKSGLLSNRIRLYTSHRVAASSTLR